MLLQCGKSSFKSLSLIIFHYTSTKSQHYVQWKFPQLKSLAREFQTKSSKTNLLHGRSFINFIIPTQKRGECKYSVLPNDSFKIKWELGRDYGYYLLVLHTAFNLTLWEYDCFSSIKLEAKRSPLRLRCSQYSHKSVQIFNNAQLQYKRQYHIKLRATFILSE